MDIRNVYGAVIFTSAALSIKDAVVEAVKQSKSLQGAYLRGAELRDAYLRDAYLQGADLRGAYLQGAYLQGADLRGAYLQGADLRGALNAETALAMIQFLPETGSFEGWKKCSGGIIVKLLIPEDAKRSHGSERKARASKATVLEIFGAEEARSGGGYETVIYRKGETVQPDGWDEDRWNVCSHGIHFFLTRIEAENYQL